MKIDYEKIKVAFPKKAWAYAEQIDSVKIGKWNGERFIFYEPFRKEESLNGEYLRELRVFDATREIKFACDKYRDTIIYAHEDFISALAHSQYYMYGEHCDWREGLEPMDGFTPLWEERGGTIVFPARLHFPNNSAGKEIVSLKLGIKNFVRYNPVPVLTKGSESYGSGLNPTGAGALEVVDYAYTGFFYANGKEVRL
ncbi:MAG: hypothetical protein LBL96_03685 [Clostridiales bacterium]|jgi:CRISPR-associated protein (TIGR03984 family)|nr:hypothetical protein [Clostridiales bacterium]